MALRMPPPHPHLVFPGLRATMLVGGWRVLLSTHAGWGLRQHCWEVGPQSMAETHSVMESAGLPALIRKCPGGLKPGNGFLSMVATWG